MADQQRRPTAVVAGGGSGIGLGCALALGRAGYHLTLVGRTPEKLDAAVAEIAGAGGSAEAFPADVRDFDRMGELGARLAPDGLDLLINSAGGQFNAPSAEITANGWKAVVELNLSGAFFLSRQLYPALRLRRGAVVNVVANLWRRPSPGLAHSAAARAGVVSLTTTLALEWAKDGIRVNAVSPGLTDTPALLDRYQGLVETVPLGRIGQVEEVVDAILFMAKAPYITGEVLTIDGGLHLV
jgi:NAD(P)-dependent dehydrogenase (short-subunit alcohol dehydrogenase family)